MDNPTKGPHASDASVVKFDRPESLDPYFGRYSGGGNGIACEHELAIIKAATASIACGADILWLMKDPSASIARYDLRKTAEALREAADRLDAVLGKHAHREAAE